ncbi:hypothetical protein [Kribbella sp. NPDC051620]|uniref:hypothetical protein n=1 Tax=Kribbella sp. NPDC051620 TaxID=3364120 RepID=UPI0037B5A67B
MADPWFLKILAPDVVLEGVVMNGRLQGADAVTEQIRTVVGLYVGYTPVYEFEAEGRRVTEYTATVDGRPVRGTGIVHVNDAGQVDQIVVNHRPLSAALTVSRLLGESPMGQRRDADEFYRPSDQSYEDLLAFTEKQGDR